ncbi:MAG: SAM-dependent methyltransferase [Limnochordia bacterium]|jgi:SAM-dependent methyltransferase|nr:SAM-dependent methyltransferase [Limnochordia bacterium]
MVKEFAILLGRTLEEGRLLGCSLSKLRKKETPYEKVSLRPLTLRGELVYQVTYHHREKELHENLTPSEAEELVLNLMGQVFRQGHFSTSEADWQVLVSKKGSMKILQHAPSRQGQDPDLAHNRSKRYILQEGTPYPFLIELGVMNQAGKVLAKRYHKFRQLNKYLEIVEDCIPYLPEDRPLRVVDFGSGKAYLTFALYHYLAQHLQRDVQIIGLDLKEDVVAFCNEMATRLGFEHLDFYAKDIRDFQAKGQVDVVVSLHACDVATDYALAQAVKWGAKVILAVPCCQHEVLGQLDQGRDPVLFEHGILKERVASLLTDAARGKLLETEGYAVQVMEFIDLEHTPKNLLIRAFLDPKSNGQQAREDYGRFRESWGIRPTLETLLTKDRG